MVTKREMIARKICYDSGMFDTVAEIKANMDHPIVKAAYAEAEMGKLELDRTVVCGRCHWTGTMHDLISDDRLRCPRCRSHVIGYLMPDEERVEKSDVGQL